MDASHLAESYGGGKQYPAASCKLAVGQRNKCARARISLYFVMIAIRIELIIIMIVIKPLLYHLLSFIKLSSSKL